MTELLSHLKRLTKLNRLDLCSTDVTERVVKELKRALPDCRIDDSFDSQRLIVPDRAKRVVRSYDVYGLSIDKVLELYRAACAESPDGERAEVEMTLDWKRGRLTVLADSPRQERLNRAVNKLQRAERR